MSREQMIVYGILGGLAVGILLILFLGERSRSRKLKMHMGEEIEKIREESGNMAGVYERFFPKQLPGMLGVKKASDITTNRQRSFTSTVMAVNVLDYTKAIHTMDSRELFQNINGVFEKVLPVIQESGGIVDKFEKSGFTGLYMEQNEQALKASISLCIAVQEMENAKIYQGFSVGLTYGEVRLGVVGYERRLSAVTMSECITRSEVLQAKAARYGARILADAEFVQRIPGFLKNYNSRFLGYFYDSGNEAAIPIYDVYDGDLPERRQSKRRTRMIFEQGVDGFSHGNYEEARLHFVEVLKADRYDLAAREYLFLCDTFCNSRQGEIEICIEKF